MAGESGRSAPDLAAEIAKYREILAADPRSRAFALLAEALRKNGQHDEAVRVAQDGLKNYPFYLSGRVALARAWFDAGNRDGARLEFEKVIAAAPDNLLAHRHLAEIYTDAGDLRQAAKSLKMVVLLDPRDERAREQLESISSPRPAPVPEPSAVLETHRHADAAPPGDEMPEMALEPPDIGDYDLPAPETFPWSGAEIPAPPPPPEQQPFPDMRPVESAAWSLDAVPEPEPEPEPSPPAVESAEGSPWSLDTIPDVPTPPPWTPETPVEAPPPFVGREPVPEPPAEPIPTAAPTLLEELMLAEESLPPAAVRQPLEPLPALSPEPALEEFAEELAQPAPAAGELSTETLADIYEQQGFHDKALDIYARLLAGQPGNPALRQKVEELRSLVGLTEKPKLKVTVTPDIPPARVVPAAPPSPITAFPPAAVGQEAPAAAAPPTPGGTASSREAEALATLRDWLTRVRVESR